LGNHNASSGGDAINLASQLGATKIVLLGFDMKAVRTKRHFHSEYIGTGLDWVNSNTSAPYTRHIVPFKQIKEEAAKLGITIVNTSLKSAITEFDKLPLTEVLL